MQDEQVRRLTMWNRIWAGLLGLVVVGLIGNAWRQSAWSRARALSISWLPNGEIRLRSASDGPFVITHLARYKPNEGEAGKAVAQIPQPIAIVDSAGTMISEETLAKLVWVDIYGRRVAAPKAGSDVKALYYRPETAVAK